MKYNEVGLCGQIGWFINSKLSKYDGHDYTCRNRGEKIGINDNISTVESYIPHYHLDCYTNMFESFITQALEKWTKLKEGEYD